MMKSKKTETHEQPVVYLGPDVPGILRSGTTYTGGLPAVLQRAGEVCAAVRCLTVPLAEAATVRTMIARREGAYPALMQQAEIYLKEELGDGDL